MRSSFCLLIRKGKERKEDFLYINSKDIKIQKLYIYMI